jgi:L-arabinose isomerase
MDSKDQIDVLKPDRDLPRLPVARAVWLPNPDLATAVRRGFMRAAGATQGSDGR